MSKFPLGAGSQLAASASLTLLSLRAKPPFPFTGTIERVEIQLGPTNPTPEDEAKLHKMHSALAGTMD